MLGVVADERELRRGLAEAVITARGARTIGELAQRAGFHRNTWSRLESGESMSERNYFAVEHALDWERGSIRRYLRGGPLPGPAPAGPVEDPTVARRRAEDAILDSQELSDDEKRVLLATLRALRGEDAPGDRRRRITG